MKLINLLLVIVSLVMSSSEVHAGRKLSKNLEKYVRLFAESDPELLFLQFNSEGTISHKHFQKSYTDFLKQLRKRPKLIAKVKWYTLIPLLRGIVAHVRFNSDLNQLITALPGDLLCRELRNSMFLLFGDAKKLFEEKIAGTRNPDLNNVLYYLQMENDTVLAGSVLLFICFVFKDLGINTLEMDINETITNAYIQEVRLRIRVMLAKQATFNPDIFRTLVAMASDETGPYYHIGARYNVVGLIIKEVADFMLDLQSEIDSFDESSIARMDVEPLLNNDELAEISFDSEDQNEEDAKLPYPEIHSEDGDVIFSDVQEPDYP